MIFIPRILRKQAVKPKEALTKPKRKRKRKRRPLQVDDELVIAMADIIRQQAAAEGEQLTQQQLVERVRKMLQR